MSSDVVIGNLIFNGLTLSSTHGFGSVGVSGKTVGTAGRDEAQLKSMGLISQSSPYGKTESSNGSKNSFQGAGLPILDSAMFSCEFGSGHKYRSISNRVWKARTSSSLIRQFFQFTGNFKQWQLKFDKNKKARFQLI